MTISTNLTIFGGTGDLTFRKLLPALYTMDITGKLPEDSRITIIGRRDYDSSHYRQIARDWVEKFTRLSFEEKAFDRFSEKIDYYRMDFSRLEAYHGLNRYYRKNDIPPTFLFCSGSPFFSIITEGLKLVHGSSSGKVILEKPFGRTWRQPQPLTKSWKRSLARSIFTASTTILERKWSAISRQSGFPIPFYRRMEFPLY